MTVGQPQHVAIIMDGNGRWALQKHLPRVAGHRAGVQRVRDVVAMSHELGIQYLTLFAFGQENWRRPPAEVSFLMSLLLRSLKREFRNLHQKNICVKILGDTSIFNAELQKAITDTETLTANNTGLKLNIALNYSGRWDILQACQKLCQRHAESHPVNISEEMLSQALVTANIPDPDLLIRTSGELRISNFFLWQMAYTELYFTETLWPDFSKECYALALADFTKRQRRFGKTSAQLFTQKT